MTKPFECYIARPSEDEAKEIIERLIANGAKPCDMIIGMDGTENTDNYEFNENQYWGYHSDCGTYLGNAGGCWANRSKQLTMAEFRSAFPCDKYDSVVDGNEDWPQTGDNVAINCHGTWNAVFIGYSTNGHCVCQMPENYPHGVYDDFHRDRISKPKSEREKFIEVGLDVVKAHQWTTEELLEALYDADFKAPENNNDNT